MDVAFLLAQADPLSGGAGWIGTGLLGSVLAWLLFVHLPAQDKKTDRLVSDCRLSEKELREKHLVTLERTRELHLAALERVVTAFKEDIALERAAAERAIERLSQSIDGLATRLRGGTPP